MKEKRQAKILELIKIHDVETQEELCALLMEAGYHVTQATVSRDIRELKLSKVSHSRNRQKYVSFAKGENLLAAKFVRVFHDGVVSIELAQNIMVIKTVAGMAMAVATALDAMQISEIVGNIAGDDCIFSAVKTVEDAANVRKRLLKILHDGV